MLDEATRHGFEAVIAYAEAKIAILGSALEGLKTLLSLDADMAAAIRALPERHQAERTTADVAFTATATTVLPKGTTVVSCEGTGVKLPAVSTKQQIGGDFFGMNAVRTAKPKAAKRVRRAAGGR